MDIPKKEGLEPVSAQDPQVALSTSGENRSVVLTSQGQLVPRPELAIEFLKGIFGESTTADIYLSSLVNSDDRDKDSSGEKHIRTRDGNNIVVFITKWTRKFRGSFFCVATLREHAVARTPGGSPRNKDNVAEIALLHSDIDLKGILITLDEVVRILRQLEFPPSVIVLSGNGVHAYWLLSEAIVIDPGDYAVERIEGINDMLADMLGGDHVSDVCRLMRLPGTINSKGGTAKMVEVVKGDYGVRYEVDDLEAMVLGAPALIARKPKASAAGRGKAAAGGLSNPHLEYAKAAGFHVPLNVDELLAGMVRGENVYMSARDIMLSMLNHGHEPDEIVGRLCQRMAEVTDPAQHRPDKDVKDMRRLMNLTLRKFPEILEKGKAYRDLEAEKDELERRSQEVIAAAAKDHAGKVSNEPSAVVAPIEDQAKIVPATAEHEVHANTRVQMTGTNDAPNVMSLNERTEARRARQAEAQAKKAEAKAAEGAAGAAKSKDKKPAIHHFVADTVLGILEARGERMLVTADQVWLYRDGLWSMPALDGKRWLETEIEKACVGLRQESTNKLIAETRGLIMRSPAVYRDEVRWDDHGMIPTRTGLVNPDTLKVTPHAPELYCTWRIEVDFEPEADCTIWLEVLNDCFADRPDAVRAKTIGALQEAYGCSLVDKKPKALNRAMVLLGDSNHGKSVVVDVLSGLLTDNPITTGIDAIEGTHGTMPFMRRAPWVLHEAFDQSKWHFSKTVKAILSADPIEINPKNRPMVTKRFTSPVIWATNHPPQFRESTAAIINRMLVFEFRTHFDPSKPPTGVAAVAIEHGYTSPQDLVLALESPGLLMWAIKGLRRAKERGFIATTEEMVDKLAEVRADSNMVARFVDECCEFTPDHMISTSDFCAAFTMWWAEWKGEDRRPPSNESIGRNIHALGEPRLVADSKQIRDKQHRYYAGVKLNEIGLEYWEGAKVSFVADGKVSRLTIALDQVNKHIPWDWEDKHVVQKLRKAFVERKEIEDAAEAERTRADREARHAALNERLVADGLPPLAEGGELFPE